VPTSQYYRIKKLIRHEGKKALRQVNRKEKHALMELSNEQKKSVLSVVGEHPEMGPTRIVEEIRKKSKGAMVIEVRMVYQYLKRKGLNTEGQRKAMPQGRIDSL